MFEISDLKYEKFALKIFTSNIFDESFVHLFSTRVGGDTPAPLQEFTLSAKDYFEYDKFAKKNLEILCKIIKADFKKLISPNQQHTDNIAILKKEEDIINIKDKPVDGIVTDLKNYPICLVFADCVPILLFDANKKVMGIVHAGWKGTAKAIVAKTVKAMVSEFFCEPKNIKAAIGAAICKKCFEVNPDVSNQLGVSIKNACGNIFLEKGDKVHVDLKLLNKIQLNEVGVNNVDVCEYCTCCDNKLFYSYRADNKITGRHGMLAMIKE